MSDRPKHDLRYIRFEGKTPVRVRRARASRASVELAPAKVAVSEKPLCDFIAWVFDRAGIDASAYRTQPLERRLPACLRTLKVTSTHAARAALEKRPELITTAVSSLLIGVTEFFREPAVFDWLPRHVLPELAIRSGPVRIWSAACSNGAELYSLAIVLAECGLLKRSHLLGTDCRRDAIEQAEAALYESHHLKGIDDATRGKYFESVGTQRRPIASLRRQVHWKVANLLEGVERGPWDIILWRNAAIYLNPSHAETIWGRLASVLAADGVLVAGKAERPSGHTGLIRAERCVYRVANHPRRAAKGSAGYATPMQSIVEAAYREKLA